MKKLFFTATALTVAMLYSCTSALTDDSTTPDVGGDSADVNTAITFTPSVNGVTRVTSDLFEVEDQISVTALDSTDLFASNIIYAYDGDIFTSDSPIFFSDESQKLTFLAVYPTTTSALDGSFSFSALERQDTGDNFEMSDLLASVTAPTSDNCPTLDFNHMMTSIVMEITTPGYEDGELIIYADATATVEVSEGKCYASSNNSTKIYAYNSGDGSFKAILAPQTISAGTLMAVYSIGGETYEWNISASKSFDSGCRYTYQWDLVENLVTLNGYINGWDDGETDDYMTDDYDDSQSDEGTIALCYVLETSAEGDCITIEIPDELSEYNRDIVVGVSDSWMHADVDWGTSWGTNCIYITVDENPYGYGREGFIEMFFNKTTDYGKEITSTIEIIIEQGAANVDVEFEAGLSFNFDCGANGEIVDLTPYDDTSLEIESINFSNTASWIDVYAIDQSIYFIEVSENNSVLDREATIVRVVTYVDGTMAYYIDTISQEGNTNSDTSDDTSGDNSDLESDIVQTTFEVDTIEFDGFGGTTSIGVETSDDMTSVKTVIATSATWLEASVENGVITIYATENSDIDERSAEVIYSVIYSTGLQIDYIITVIQAGTAK